MNYEKKYKEALEKAMKLYERGTITESLSYLFPELKESEDERIRKALLRFHKSTIDIDGIKGGDILAWLEKQGEKSQGKSALEAIKEEKVDDANKVEPKGYNSIDPHFFKTTDKVEPKFHEGEWIVWQNKCYKVNDNGCGYELIDQNGLSTSLEYGTIDESAHLWDATKDAKDGDVLFHSDSASNGIFIFKEIIDKGFAKEVICYCDYDSEDGFCLGEKHTCCWANSKILRPATKEQRDLLFQKMREAGYEWDAEKKELKKISQRTISAEAKEAMYGKPTAWSEEDEQIILSIEQAMNCASLLNIVPVKTDIIRTWLKSLKERYTWKPSEEQVKAFEHFVRSIGESGYTSPYENNTKFLYSLLNDLKKLTE